MSKLELEVINNYIEWYETPPKRYIKLKLINLKSKYLVKLWMKENNCNEEAAKQEIAKLIIAVLYDNKEENNDN